MLEAIRLVVRNFRQVKYLEGGNTTVGVEPVTLVETVLLLVQNLLIVKQVQIQESH